MKKFLQIFVGSALIIFCSRTIAFVVVVPTSPRTITESLIVANHHHHHHHHHHHRRRRHIKNTATLWAGNSNISDDDADENSNKMKSTTGNTNVGGLDGDMKTKLLTESIAPWRTLRLFFYGALGSGAFIGGLINGSGAIAASASPDFNLQTEVRMLMTKPHKLIKTKIESKKTKKQKITLIQSFNLMNKEQRFSDK